MAGGAQATTGGWHGEGSDAGGRHGGTEARGHAGTKGLAAEAIRQADGLRLLDGWTRRHGLDRSTWDRTHNGVAQRVEVDANGVAYLYEEGKEVLLAAPQGGGLEYVLRYASDPTIEDEEWAGTDHGPDPDRDDERVDGRVEIGADGRPAGREAEGGTRRLDDADKRIDGLTAHLRDLVGVVDRLTVQAQALAERVERLERWVSMPRPASELLGDGDRQPAIGKRHEHTSTANTPPPVDAAQGPEQSGPGPLSLRGAIERDQRRLRDEVGRLVRIGQAEADIGRVSALYAIDRSFPNTLEVIGRLLAVGRVLSFKAEDGVEHLRAELAAWRLAEADARMLIDTWRRFDAGGLGFVIERERVDQDEAMASIVAKREAVGNTEGGAS